MLPIIIYINNNKTVINHILFVDSTAFRNTALTAGCFMFLAIPFAATILPDAIKSKQSSYASVSSSTHTIHDPNSPKYAISEFRTTSLTKNPSKSKSNVSKDIMLADGTLSTGNGNMNQNLLSNSHMT